MKKARINPQITTYVDRLLQGKTLLPESPENLIEVVGVLASYGIVLDAYSKNLIFIADQQFLVLFPIFKYFNGEINPSKILRYFWHDRINYEYAEYCMRTMLWHGGGGLDTYLDSDVFLTRCRAAIAAKVRGNLLMRSLNRLFPDFLPEQVRQLAYYSALGQFWRIMSDMFNDLADKYDQGKIQSIGQVVEHIKAGLVADAATPITYAVNIDGQRYELIPESAGLTFLPDTAIPYVETIFFRGTPFFGTVSYNAQAQQISPDQSRFDYGALYADPIPIGGAGIPPTLLMQDMRHYVPDYLHQLYQQTPRGEADIRVQLCQSFQKSMFCVTNAALNGLLPFPKETDNPEEQTANRKFLSEWVERLMDSRLDVVQIV